MKAQRGVSLIEVLIVTAIFALIAGTMGVAYSLGTRSYEVAAAASQFKAMIDAGREEAQALGDATTIYLAPSASGFTGVLWNGHPGGLKTARTPGMHDIVSSASASELAVLHGPAYALVLHGSGDIGAYDNTTAGTKPTTAEIACPASGQFVFRFAVNSEHQDVAVPCAQPITAGSLFTAPPATPGPGYGPPTQHCTIASQCTPPPDTAGSGPLQVDPITIVFPSTSALPVIVQVNEDNYFGAFSVGNSASLPSCSGTSNVGPGGPGPYLRIAVSPIQPGPCGFDVSDGSGHHQTVSVTTYAPSPTPAPAPSSSTATPGPLTVTPPTLTFASHTDPAQGVTISETNYSGAFSFALGPCGTNYGYTVTAGDGVHGPSTSYAVSSAVDSTSCVIAVTDDHGGYATLTLSTGAPSGGPSLQPSPGPSQVSKPEKYVCSSQPFGTDLGPDPDGIHEDYSNGVACASPSPSHQIAGCAAFDPSQLDSYGFYAVKCGPPPGSTKCSYVQTNGSVSHTITVFQTNGTQNWGVYDSSGNGYAFALTFWGYDDSADGNPCADNQNWSPNDPQQQFGDPNLP